jgi:preprotein translocase subunit SecF
MAFALSKNILLIIIFVLFAMLMLNLFFGCRSFYEGFEAKEMTEEDVEAIKNIDPEEAAVKFQQMLKKGMLSTESKIEETTEESPDIEPQEQDDEEVKPASVEQKSTEIVKEMLTKEKRPLTKKEIELFEAISKDQVSNEDLEKLVKAGIVTESLVERFLNQMQEDVPTKTKDVVEGFSCERDFATF